MFALLSSVTVHLLGVPCTFLSACIASLPGEGSVFQAERVPIFLGGLCFRSVPDIFTQGHCRRLSFFCVRKTSADDRRDQWIFRGFRFGHWVKLGFCSKSPLLAPFLCSLFFLFNVYSSQIAVRT